MLRHEQPGILDAGHPTHSRTGLEGDAVIEAGKQNGELAGSVDTLKESSEL